MEETKGFVTARDALAALEQYQGCFFPHSAAVKIINQLSREDVEPVVHARWIVEFDDRGWKKHSCSGCGYFRRTDIHVSLNWHYCPNCGAKMDVEEYYNE